MNKSSLNDLKAIAYKIELNSNRETFLDDLKKEFLENLLDYLQEREDELERIKAANNLFDGE